MLFLLAVWIMLEAAFTSPGSAATPPNELARVAPSLGIYAPVVGAEGTVYVSSSKGILAIDAHGTEKWKFHPGGRYG